MGDERGSGEVGLVAAFPISIRADAQVAVNALELAAHPPIGRFEVRTDGEGVTIPYRIYNPEPDFATSRSLSERQQLILRCLFTRHNSGWVRQRNLEAVIASSETWVVPFVVQLIGEYVIEILDAIRAGLSDLEAPGSSRRQVYAGFLAENVQFFDLTAARVTSYWACYYRMRYPKYRPESRKPDHLGPSWLDYPGFELVTLLRALEADSQHAAREPRTDAE